MALDVSGANRNNGANVQIWNINNSRAQLFTVRYNDDDTVRILAAFTGKSVDVNHGDIKNGTNVQQWTNNDTRAQKWVIAATGNSITFRNKTYQTYKIQIAADTTFVLDVYGTSPSAGSNCLLYKDDGGTDQNWIFVPRPKLRSGGVYELHSMLDNNLVVDISSWSKTDGANALVWPTHGGNNQKFVIIEEETDKWRIRNVNSGKYLDIKGNEAKNSATVVQWGEPANVRHQQWKILERDTNDHIYKGVECAVVSIGAYGLTSDGNTYMLHVYNSWATNGNDVNIYEDAGGNGYRWLLYPTEATDPTIPIPANLGLVYAVGDLLTWTHVEQGMAYPTWTCTKSWTNTGPNHYEWRMRKRYMSSKNSTWLDWSDYTAWETANYTQDKTTAWLADAIDGTYSISRYKNLQVEFQVRCVGVDETENLVGQAATQSFYFLWNPTYTFQTAGITPEGLRIGYTSDYTAGMANMTITGIYKADEVPPPSQDDWIWYRDNNLLKNDPYFDALDSEGTLLIPYDSFREIPTDGELLELRCKHGTDQISFIGTATARVTAQEDTGYGLDATPVLEMAAGRMLKATVPYEDARMWLMVDGKTVELEGEDGVFLVPYPFAKDFTLFTSVVNDSSWGTNSTYINKENPLVINKECHAWNWKGGSFLLEANSDALVTDRELKPVYEANVLNSRKHESVSFATTVRGSYTAVGLMLDNVTESTHEMLEALVAAHHVHYRAPSGETADVAITGASYTRHSEHTFVQIDMIEETV